MQMFPMYSGEIARLRAEEFARFNSERRKAAQLRPVRSPRSRRQLKVARPLATVLIGVRLAAPADEASR